MNGNGDKQITVSWTANRSFDANTVAGGGHKIYYDAIANITSSTQSVVTVPNTTSTTTGTITALHSGCTYYVRVAGYSALNPAGGELSTKKAIKIP